MANDIRTEAEFQAAFPVFQDPGSLKWGWHRAAGRPDLASCAHDSEEVAAKVRDSAFKRFLRNPPAFAEMFDKPEAPPVEAELMRRAKFDAAIMDRQQRSILERIELNRLEPTGDQFEAAWEAAGLAYEMADRGPAAEAFAILYICLTCAEACERRLNSEGRSSTGDDNRTAAQRIRSRLDHLTNVVISRLPIEGAPR
jgi:hypothetical protein